MAENREDRPVGFMQFETVMSEDNVCLKLGRYEGQLSDEGKPQDGYKLLSEESLNFPPYILEFFIEKLKELEAEYNLRKSKEGELNE